MIVTQLSMSRRRSKALIGSKPALPLPTIDKSSIASRGVLMGLVQANLMKPNSEGDFEDQLAWLERIGLLQEDPITEDES